MQRQGWVGGDVPLPARSGKPISVLPKAESPRKEEPARCLALRDRVGS